MSPGPGNPEDSSLIRAVSRLWDHADMVRAVIQVEGFWSPEIGTWDLVTDSLPLVTMVGLGREWSNLLPTWRNTTS